MISRKKSNEQSGRRVDHPRQMVPIYSYHNKKDNTQENNNKAENNRAKFRLSRHIWLEKFGFIILAVAVCASIVSVLYLSNQSIAIIEPVSSGSGPSFSGYKQAVENSANSLISSSILNRNKITFDNQKVISTLSDKYPMFSTISIALPLIDHRPVIYLTPATPALIINSNNNQYLTNKNGQIILVSPGISNLKKMNLPQIDYGSTSFSNGSRVLTTNEVVFIQTIVYELGLKSLSISHMNLPQGTSELDVYISGLSYYVKFDLQSMDAQQQSGSFLAAKNYLAEKGTAPSQYMDVRSDGRVYYK